MIGRYSRHHLGRGLKRVPKRSISSQVKDLYYNFPVVREVFSGSLSPRVRWARQLIRSMLFCGIEPAYIKNVCDFLTSAKSGKFYGYLRRKLSILINQNRGSILTDPRASPVGGTYVVTSSERILQTPY